MKGFLGLAACLTGVLTTIPSSAAEQFWTAICRGERDANYTQTIGGQGTFNTGNGDGTYVTLPIRQIAFQPDKIVCGAVPGSASVGQVCADNVRQVIILKLRDPKRPNAPLKAIDYCRALVKIH